MTNYRNRNSIFCSTILCLILAIMGNTVFAASQTLRLDEDTNSRLVVENAIIDGNETTIFFWTWPYMGDPNAGKPCPLNFYSVTLRPGLPSVQPEKIAKGVCGGITAKGGILDHGDALIMVRDRLERWRGGERISSESFSAIGATNKLRVTTDNIGSQFYDISPTGDVVVAIPVGGYIAKDFPDSKLILAGIKPGGKKRWQLNLNDVGDYYTINNLWAARDGGALLYISPTSVDLMVAVVERQLRFITADGTPSQFMLIELEEPFDMASIRPGSEEDMQKFFEHQRNAKPEKIKMLSARPRDRGGFDVLLHRTGGIEGRAGHFLYRLAPDGSLQSETALGSHIEEHGLEDWFDFYVSGGQLVLLSRALVTQHSVKVRSNKWMQNVVSRIDLETGVPASRLIPLDLRYLEAAMTSGDENRQNLEGQPGGEPVMLTSVGGVPLSVGLGILRGRFTLRLNEATEDLLVFTEAIDERNAATEKEKASRQRKAARKTSMKQMNDDMAANVGMTPEEYNSLSKKEQTEAMIREGDFDAMMTSMMKQAQGMQQSMDSSGASPEMNAQMQAAMAQAQQALQGAGYELPGSMAGTTSPTASPQAKPTSQNNEPAELLIVDALMRGHLQFKNPDGTATTLTVINRETEERLLNKEYADGVIDEYLNFGRYKLPLEQIGVVIKNTRGDVLEDLTPKTDS
jgi:hypothetical protein